MPWTNKTNKTNKTSTPSIKHSDACTMAFGRPSKHDNCPRCQELKAGSPARSGWQKDYFEKKARDEAMFKRAMAHHRENPCENILMGLPCVCFDW